MCTAPVVRFYLATARGTGDNNIMDISEYSELDEVRDAAWDAYDLDSFIAGYEDAADSDSTHEMLVGDDRADDDYIIGWHADTIKQFASECWEFASENVLDLVASGLDARRAGCDFWLTRNRHGAGYWDEGYRQSDEANAALRRLTEASHASGPAELYVGDDGWIYQS